MALVCSAACAQGGHWEQLLSVTHSAALWLDLDLTHCSGSELPLWIDAWDCQGISEKGVDRGGEHLLTRALISILIITSTWISEDPMFPQGTRSY